MESAIPSPTSAFGAFTNHVRYLFSFSKNYLFASLAFRFKEKNTDGRFGFVRVVSG